jgi:hypothetical protein
MEPTLNTISEFIRYFEECSRLAVGSDEGDRLSDVYSQLAIWLGELRDVRRRDAENARRTLGEYRELREAHIRLQDATGVLVKMMDGSGNCDHCPYEGGCDCNVAQLGDGCRLADDLRGLGIEV